MKLRRGLLLCLGLLLAACTSSAGPFVDDFSDPASGWGAASTESYVRGYDSGKYLIRIDVPHWFVWTMQDRTYKDVAVEVLARSEGATDNHFGVICRYQDEKNFYSAQISSDGYAGIFRMKNGVLKLLCHESMLPVPAILGGASINSIYFECIGSSLTLAVNGVPVDTCDDKSFKDGDIGLIAGTYKEGGTLVAFDDLRVIQP